MRPGDKAEKGDDGLCLELDIGRHKGQLCKTGSSQGFRSQH